MSVFARLQDAEILYKNGRFDGALLSVLVAVAATSRRRFPKGTPSVAKPGDKMRDGEAFARFLRQEMIVVTQGVREISVKFRGSAIPVEEFFYTFLRCELIHSAEYARDVRFEDPPVEGWTIRLDTEGIHLSRSWLSGLANCVRFAVENELESPELQETPEDVLKWFMFGKRRDSELVQQYWKGRRGPH